MHAILYIDSDSEVVEIIIEDSDEEDEVATVTQLSVKKIFGLTVAFLLNFRAFYNISDHAVALLLKFFKYIFLLIGSMFNIPELNEKAHLPQSINGCYSFTNLDPDPYQVYVVCPKCHMLYDQSVQSLTVGTSINPESKKCSFVEFPEHPQSRYREPCNTTKVQYQKNGKYDFKPRKVYYYL